MNTIDILPTKTIVKLELCVPTERYRLGAPPCTDYTDIHHLIQQY